jgi:RNA exonuclease 4
MNQNWKKFRTRLSTGKVSVDSSSSSSSVHKKRRRIEKQEEVIIKDVKEDVVIESTTTTTTKEEVTTATATTVSTPKKIGKYLALDCEMVGTYSGKSRSLVQQQSSLARVSIVDYELQTVLDLYVKPKDYIVDYRTPVSGIKPHHILRHGVEFEEAQRKVYDLIKDRTIIGHDIKHDLSALKLKHFQLIDTQKLYHQRTGMKKAGLKKLAKELLGIKIQDGMHCSVEDAKITMSIFKILKVKK